MTAILVVAGFVVLCILSVILVIHLARKSVQIIKNSDGKYEVREKYKGDWISLRTFDTEEEAKTFKDEYVNGGIL